MHFFQRRILAFVLVASLLFCNGSGVPSHFNRHTFNRPIRPRHIPISPIHRPVFPGHRPGIHRPIPGYGGTTMMPMVKPTAPPASHPINEEDNFLSAELGVRIPPHECVISKDQFTEHVIGMDWIGPYVIDDDSPLNPGFSYNFNVLWTEVNSTFIRRRGSAWYEERCDYIDAEFKHIGGEKAIYGATGGGDSFAISGRADYFVSFDPTRYVIFYICYEVNKSTGGRCPTTEIFLLVKDQRDSLIDEHGTRTGDIVLNDIHWTLIEETFKNCLGQQFVDHSDPRIAWFWIKEDCAKPGTSQFMDGVEQG